MIPIKCIHCGRRLGFRDDRGRWFVDVQAYSDGDTWRCVKCPPQNAKKSPGDSARAKDSNTQVGRG
jgi:hypothetical protein